MYFQKSNLKKLSIDELDFLIYRLSCYNQGLYCYDEED